MVDSILSSSLSLRADFSLNITVRHENDAVENAETAVPASACVERPIAEEVAKISDNVVLDVEDIVSTSIATDECQIAEEIIPSSGNVEPICDEFISAADECSTAFSIHENVALVNNDDDFSITESVAPTDVEEVVIDENNYDDVIDIRKTLPTNINLAVVKSARGRPSGSKNRSGAVLGGVKNVKRKGCSCSTGCLGNQGKRLLML